MDYNIGVIRKIARRVAVRVACCDINSDDAADKAYGFIFDEDLDGVEVWDPLCGLDEDAIRGIVEAVEDDIVNHLNPVTAELLQHTAILEHALSEFSKNRRSSIESDVVQAAAETLIRSIKTLADEPLQDQ